MKQKKQIIFLTKYYYPHVGGVEKHTEEVAGRLLSKDFDVLIITEQFKKSLPLIEKKKNLTIYRIPISKNDFLYKFFIWRWFFKNFAVLKKADIIHVHDIFYWILPFRLLIPRHKIYVTFHGYEGYPFKAKWRILRKMYENLANGNICVGDFMKKWYGTKPNFVIYGAVSRPKNFTIKPQEKSIIFFGRLDEQTNILEYVKSFKILSKKDKKWKLSVFGNGLLKRKIDKKVKVFEFDKNIGSKIDKYEYVFVSRYLSILEAMISKRLVFALYDNKIKKDYLLDSPFRNLVVTASNPEELSSKLLYFSKNPKDKEKKIKEGYEFAKGETWEKIVNVYLRLWGWAK